MIMQWKLMETGPYVYVEQFPPNLMVFDPCRVMLFLCYRYIAILICWPGGKKGVL